MTPRILSFDSRSLAAFLLAALLLAYFLAIHPRGASPEVIAAWSNQGTALAFVAVGQTIVVLSRGIDLSIGPVMALANAAASELLAGSSSEIAAGIVAVVLVGAVCGAVNGAVVVVLRIQPIVATLATGAVYTGLALLIRPSPGGAVDEGLSDALTGVLFDVAPTSLVLLTVTVGLVWGFLRTSRLGRTIVAVGSAEGAAVMSGLPVATAKLSAYSLAGLFAACGGLFLSLQTLSGDASIGTAYTLNAVAAVVLGGTSLAGGVGSVAGSIAGAFALRTIGSLIFFTGLEPMAQPLFEGLVLLVAVAAGATRLVGVGNRLEIFR